MTPVPRLPTAGPRVSVPTVVGVLVVLAGLIVAERVHTYAEPLENDIAGYAIVAHEVRAGRPLYADLWFNKPPLLPATYALAERLVGYGPGEVFLLNVAAALVTLGGAYALGTAGGGRVAGLLAAGLWTILGDDAMTQANQPNAEVFVNAALTWAAALLILPPSARHPWRRGLAVGGLFTAASLYEQHMVIVCGTLAVAYAWAGGRDQVRRRLAVVATAAGVGAVVWAGLAGYFAAVGRLRVAIDVLFSQNLAYGAKDSAVGGLAGNLIAALRPAWLAPAFMDWALGPIALTVAAALLGRHPGRPWAPRTIVWAGWAVGTWLTVALPGTFFAHFYQGWIPPACAAGGWAAARLLDLPRARPVGRGIVAAVLALLGGRQLSWFAAPADEWANLKYGQSNFVEQVYLARRLATVLRPGERFWVWGSDLTIYLAALRSPPSGVLYMEPLLLPRNAFLYDQLIADLDRVHPPLVVVDFPWFRVLPQAAPIRPWLKAHYDRVDTNLTCPTYDLFVRRGDPDLAQRLLHPPPAPAFRREPYRYDAPPPTRRPAPAAQGP